MMDDAISRSAVLDQLQDYLLQETCGINRDVSDVGVGLEIALNTVKGAPDLDVAPVVHARWIRDDLGNTRCSNCHTRLPCRHCYDDEDGYEWDDEIDETPWCMYCGARMDGEA